MFSPKNLMLFIIMSFLFLCARQTQGAFPFRNVKKGLPLPHFCVYPLTTQEKLCSENLRGKLSILFFWGADLPIKKERTIKILQEFRKTEPFLKKRAVRFISINVQNDDLKTIEEVVKSSKTNYPIYVDRHKEAYKALGIFVMPSVLIIDKQGKIVEGEAYSHYLIKKIKEKIQTIMGEKHSIKKDTKNSKIKQKTTKEKMADRYFNMGKIMLKRRMPKEAIKEFQKALELNPLLYKAHIAIGCIYLQEGNIKQAIHELKISLKHIKSLKGEICLARAIAKQGDTKQAINRLKELLLHNNQNPEIHFALGELYEQEKRYTQALQEYKKAYKLLKNNPL